MGEEFTHILDSLGWAVLHSTWQGGVAFLAVILWRLALRGRSPALRHAGQMLALVACFGAFAWTFAAYLGLPKFAIQSGATLLDTSPGETSHAFSRFMAPFDPAAATAISLSRITPLLACLWALGFAAMALKYAFAFGQIQQLRVRGIQNPSAVWLRRFQDLALQSGVSDRVKLYISANVAGPVTLGFFKPVVLVPVGFLTCLPTDQVEAILRHELAHIRRYDYALNLIQTAVKTVLFFHPAIHIICRWADQDREQACDDLAVQAGHDPLALVRGLAALRLQSQPSLSLAATGSNEDMPLLNRLTRLAGGAPKRGRPEYIFMSLVSALLLGSVYLGSTSRAEAHPAPAMLPESVVVAVPVKPQDAHPAPPAPPKPPVMRPFSPEAVNSQYTLQAFMESETHNYRAFIQDMETYAADLEAFLKTADLDEDAQDYLTDNYVEIIEDVTEAFEDRRQDIEELYIEHLETQAKKISETASAKAQYISKTDLSNCKSCQEHFEEKMKGLQAALDGLEAAEREIKFTASASARKASQNAITQARRDIAKAQADAKRAQLQAQTAKSVANAETRLIKATRKNHEAFRNKVMSALLKDGLIQSADDTVVLSHPNNVMSLNGQPLKKGLRGKYCALWDKYGFIDNHSEVTITPESLTVLTDWKDGRHTTKVTYGTFNTQ